MESPRCSVKVVEVCRIPPPPDRSDSDAPESLPLTFFDILWLRFPPVTRLFFYELSETDSFNHSILPKLKHSLSLSLRHYLPLAGHLVWPENSPKPVIEYLDGDGVSFTVAESNGVDIDSRSGDSFLRGVKECQPLIPQLASSHERAELIAFQVTLFPGSGFSIGITSHHAVMDGKTSTSFVKLWAKICHSLGESPVTPYVRPFYDRTVIADLVGLEQIYLNAWMNEDGTRDNRSLMLWELNLKLGSVRGTFELSQEKIKKLKKSVAATERINLHVSTFLVVCSYVSVCIAKVALRASPGCNCVCLTLPADMRSRLNPSVPAEYFGNCVGGRAVVMETRALLGEDGVSVALEAIGRALKGLEGKDILKDFKNIVSKIIAGRASDGDGKKDSVRMINISGSPRFEVYSTDFGFGRPKKVEMASLKTGGICLSDGKNGDGGVEIGLVLKLQEMEAFAFEFINGLENI